MTDELRIIIIRNAKHMSYGLLAEHYGLTRNQVAGVLWRYKNPPETRVYSASGRYKNTCGRASARSWAVASPDTAEHTMTALAKQFATSVDLPFLPPPDTVLDIPVPPSVNRLRKINYANRPLLRRWKKAADMMLMASGQFRKAKAIKGPFELQVILDEGRCRCDPDNVIKVAIDYLRRLELVVDDSPKYARQILITWGEAPQGCRLILRPCEVRA